MEKQVLILIVEDDLLNSELLEVFLKRKNLTKMLCSLIFNSSQLHLHSETTDISEFLFTFSNGCAK